MIYSSKGIAKDANCYHSCFYECMLNSTTMCQYLAGTHLHSRNCFSSVMCMCACMHVYVVCACMRVTLCVHT